MLDAINLPNSVAKHEHERAIAMKQLVGGGNVMPEGERSTSPLQLSGNSMT